MRVLLATPFYDLPRKTYGLEGDADMGYGPPLGIAYLAAVLREAGHEVVIHDPAPGERSDTDVLEVARRTAPDVIGLSVISCLYEQAKALARALDAEHETTPIMVGGPHPSCNPTAPLEDCESFDVSVAGEAEDRIVALVEGAMCTSSLAEVRGIAFRDGGKIIQTPPPTESTPLDELPWPARDLLGGRLGRNQPYQHDREKSTWMIASRGCPHGRCTFCYYSHDGAPPYRRRSVTSVNDELEHLVRNEGFDHVSFLDEDFVGDRDWTMELCEELVRRELKLEWYCETRVSAVTPELLEAMRKAGCYLIYYGIESGSPELLKMMRKGITVPQARRAVALTKKAGIQVVTSFILGLPNETKERGLQTIDLALELDSDYAVFHYFHPARGLPILEDCLAGGEILALDHPDFARVNYVPDGYGSIDAVEDMLSLAYRRFFMRPRYIARRMARLQGLADLERNALGAFIVASRSRGILLAPLRLAARGGLRLVKTASRVAAKVEQWSGLLSRTSSDSRAGAGR